MEPAECQQSLGWCHVSATGDGLQKTSLGYSVANNVDYVGGHCCT